MKKDNDEVIFIRNVSREQKNKLNELRELNNYDSLNQFMLDQISIICENETLDLYDTNFAKEMVTLNKKMDIMLQATQKMINDKIQDESLLFEIKSLVDNLGTLLLSDYD